MDVTRGCGKNASIYTVQMNLILSLDDKLLARARRKAEGLGKGLDELVSDYLRSIVDGDDAERSIEEFKRLSGQGDSRGWRFDRGEVRGRS